MTVPVFLIFVAVGLLLGLLLWGESALVNHTRLLPVTIVLDTVWALIAVAAYAAMLYFVTSGKLYAITAVAYALSAFLPVCFLPGIPADSEPRGTVPKAAEGVTAKNANRLPKKTKPSKKNTKSVAKGAPSGV